MRPKEKAKSMIDKYYSHLTDVLMNAEAKEFATVCSLLCAREVITELNKLPSKDLSDFLREQKSKIFENSRRSSIGSIKNEHNDNKSNFSNEILI